MDTALRAQAMRLVLRWLRHRPDDAGLEIEGDGWVGLAAVAEALQRAGYSLSADDVALLARGDQRGKLEIEGARIRARYGHSIDLGAPAHESAPPKVLYAAAPPRYAERIAATGLHPVKRRFVHLYVDRRVAVERGVRRGMEPLVLEVAAAEAHAAGVRFFPRGGGVWLCDPVPPEHLTPLRGNRTMAPGEDVETSAGPTPQPARGNLGPIRRRPRHSPRRR